MYNINPQSKKYGLWNPWLKKNKQNLKGKLLGGPAQVPPKRVSAFIGDGQSFNAAPFVNERFLGFRDYLLEFAYGHHNEIETDSKLIWLGIKRHLRNPNNFKKLLDSHKKRESGGLFTTTIEHTYSIPLHELPIHQDLKDKYSGFSHINLGPRLSGLEQLFKTTKASTSLPRRSFLGLIGPKKSHISLWGISSLDPESVKEHSFEKTHKDTMKELNSNFDSWHHEFVHIHDMLHKGLSPYDVRSTKGNYDKYLNEPMEIHARKHQLHYELEKSLRLHPQWFHGVRSPEGYEHMKKDENILDNKTGRNFHILMRLYHRGSPPNTDNLDKLDKVRNALHKALEELMPTKGPWHGIYFSLNPENKQHFDEVIDKLWGQHQQRINKSHMQNVRTILTGDLKRKRQREAQKRYQERKKRGLVLSKPKGLSKPKIPATKRKKKST